MHSNNLHQICVSFFPSLGCCHLSLRCFASLEYEAKFLQFFHFLCIHGTLCPLLILLVFTSDQLGKTTQSFMIDRDLTMTILLLEFSQFCHLLFPWKVRSTRTELEPNVSQTLHLGCIEEAPFAWFARDELTIHPTLGSYPIGEIRSFRGWNITISLW